ncbi:AMP-binding enzyme [Pseudomassariella vexata]|uniref:Very long-chain fatty acid transport protein n=1 Tax=Pseudomassariella vexata TaxID=1141098 RepID=A0A1Y2E651_9PEZI|nr:AMP-binding enzyme [Pseudomassariella vexata]ORY66989.1 AMP-binding enzyme [Pseudomassariella vexata]
MSLFTVPLTLALPAAAAGLAYLNAKSAFWYDWTLFRGVVPAFATNKWREYIDKANAFYKLETRAKSGASADRIFLMYEDNTWTYAQSYDTALRYGNWLKRRYNLKKGDVVAIDMMNSDHFVLLCFGLWSIGVKPAFINYNLTGKALTHCIEAAKAVLMLVDPQVQHNVDDSTRATLGDLQIDILTADLIAEILSTDPVRAPDSDRSGDLGRDMAVLIYTSGTTGLPKAAIVSWSKLTLAGTFVGGWLGTKPSDIFYTCMPIYHSSATVMGLSHVLESGSTFAIGRKFSTKTFWKEARAFKATQIQYVGETCRYLLAAPPQIDPATGENLDKKHNIRLAFGNGLRPDVWERFRERFGIENISEFYGATEGFLATWNTSKNDHTIGAIGRNGWLYAILMKQRMAIIDVDHDTDKPIRDPKTGLGRQVPRGQVGELMFMLPDDMDKDFQGYYNNKEATNSKIVRDLLRKGDGYFRSGDLVSWDNEGRMYFHDRIGDTFRWKSENVATTEVSQTIGMHPSVQEANVYGVELPNHDGRAGCAALALQVEPDEKVMQSIAEHAKKALPKYAVPIFLRVVKDMSTQTTGTNKQQKHQLRAQGVDPAKIGNDDIYWLKGDTYVKFGPRDWDSLNGGRVKL